MSHALAATYVVSSTGPFRSIQSAANAAHPGDRILVRAGTYHERLVIPRSGSPKRPIVIEGERGPNGERLAVLDPSEPAPRWVPAPEIGEGVYKTTGLRYNPAVITLDGKQLARIWDGWMAGKRSPTVRANGIELLGKPADFRCQTQYLKVTIPFWEWVGAVYGHRDGTTYIRFHGDKDPNSQPLRVSSGGAGILIRDQSHIVIRGLQVRSAQFAVSIEGKQAQHNVIADNALRNGRTRVLIAKGAAHNHVRQNDMTLGFYAAGQPGAWDTGDRKGKSAYRYGSREFFYNFFKHVVAHSASDDNSVKINTAGEGNQIYDNTIHHGLIGISSRKTRNLNVYRNIVHHMSSIGIVTLEGLIDAAFYENFVYDCNINLRLHHLDAPREQFRREYHYRNRYYQPEAVGTHIYTHFYNDKPDAYHPELYLYHNTFAGGRRALSISGWAVGSGGLPNTRFVNNIFSSATFCAASREFIGGKPLLGLCDYNWVGGRYRHGLPAWFGSHNIRAAGQGLWNDGRMPDFRLPANSPARNAGIDLSQAFTLAGVDYSPLPGMKPGYFAANRPDLGAMQFGQQPGGKTDASLQQTSTRASEKVVR